MYHFTQKSGYYVYYVQIYTKIPTLEFVRNRFLG